jgi:hypothetical protein
MGRGPGASESAASVNGKRPCGAPTKRGTPCAAFALPGRDRCISHDPERAEALAAARSKGGQHCARLRVLQGQRAKLDTPRALVRYTAGIILDVAEGKLLADVGRVVLYGINIQRTLLESSDLERRLAALEAQLSTRGRQRWHG